MWVVRVHAGTSWRSLLEALVQVLVFHASEEAQCLALPSSWRCLQVDPLQLAQQSGKSVE